MRDPVLELWREVGQGNHLHRGVWRECREGGERLSWQGGAGVAGGGVGRRRGGLHLPSEFGNETQQPPRKSRELWSRM